MKKTSQPYEQSAYEQSHLDSAISQGNVELVRTILNSKDSKYLRINKDTGQNANADMVKLLITEFFGKFENLFINAVIDYDKDKERSLSLINNVLQNISGDDFKNHKDMFADCLSISSRAGHTEIVKLFIENAPELINAENHISKAIKYKKIDTIKLFIEKFPDKFEDSSVKKAFNKIIQEATEEDHYPTEVAQLIELFSNINTTPDQHQNTDTGGSGILKVSSELEAAGCPGASGIDHSETPDA